MVNELFSSLVFWSSDIRQTDGRTESDAYEPTVHMHRCAQKMKKVGTGKDDLIIWFGF